jgi:hypothetical protein
MERPEQPHARGRVRSGKACEEHDDQEDQPHVIGFPYRADRAGNLPSLIRGARTDAQEVPDPAAEIGAAEQRIRDEGGQHHQRKEQFESYHACLAPACASRRRNATRITRSTA